jgi:hypothetical protein
MKRWMMIAIVALPLVAEEPKKAEATPAQTTTATTTTAAPDSPLVAAAKRANRGRKKSATPVITNASLKNSKGHITTTTNQGTLNMPAPSGPSMEEQANVKRAEEKRIAEANAAKAKAEEAERQRKLAAAAAQAEEGLYENPQDDPAAAEAAADNAAGQKPPQR